MSSIGISSGHNPADNRRSVVYTLPVGGGQRPDLEGGAVHDHLQPIVVPFGQLRLEFQRVGVGPAPLGERDVKVA